MQPVSAAERPLAIIAALEEEACGLVAEMAIEPGHRLLTIGGRDVHVGRLWGRSCVLTLAGIGKVAAATTATGLIHSFDVEAMVFTGVAGAAATHVRVGDVVIADMLLQHDFDASPLFPRFEVPLTGRSRFDVHAGLADALAAASQRCVDEAATLIGSAHLLRFDIVAPAVHRGLVVSGDRFVSSVAASDELRQVLPDALAVEMEGAAVAQVCHDYGIPFAAVRTISDAADDSAHVDFPIFLRDVASHYSYEIIKRFISFFPPEADDVG